MGEFFPDRVLNRLENGVRSILIIDRLHSKNATDSTTCHRQNQAIRTIKQMEIRGEVPNEPGPHVELVKGKFWTDLPAIVSFSFYQKDASDSRFYGRTLSYMRR